MSDAVLLTAALTKLTGLGNATLKKFFLEEDFQKKFQEESFAINNIIVSMVEVMSISAEIQTLIEKYQVEIVPIWSEYYPINLKQINDAPSVLYCKGSLDILANKYISIVGTRKPSIYGVRNTKKIVSELTNSHLGVISGMAMGVDAVAQKAAIDNDIKTIAVLVGGPHKATPKLNTVLYKNILEKGGLIISEQLPETLIHPGMFASRNRIVAGISSGVVVIEGGRKSGSLITAQLGLDYGKEVFALPGNIDSIQSEGTNYLIKSGQAKLIQSTFDILEEFGIIQVGQLGEINSLQLTKYEREIYDLLVTGSYNEDELCRFTRRPSYEIISVCLELEIKKIIYKDILGRYILV